LASEDIAHGGFEALRNANILSEMIQRAHWKDTNGGIGPCQDTGHCADGTVASTCHYWMAVLAQRVGGERRDIVASTGHHNVRSHPEFTRNTSNVRLGLLHVNRMAVEDAGRT
jgi:hypothetical protein